VADKGIEPEAGRIRELCNKAQVYKESISSVIQSKIAFGEAKAAEVT
jgi:hypothetical protein